MLATRSINAPDEDTDLLSTCEPSGCELIGKLMLLRLLLLLMLPVSLDPLLGDLCESGSLLAPTRASLTESFALSDDTVD